MTPKMNGAQAFFKTLVVGAIDAVFGGPGTSQTQIIAVRRPQESYHSNVGRDQLPSVVN
jgi:thiamine pyrophosphate-dependent acetolactate synthase large subunit-like protein